MTRIRSLIGNQSPREVDDDVQASAVLVDAQGVTDQMTTHAHAHADRTTLDQAPADPIYAWQILISSGLGARGDTDQSPPG